MTINLNKSEGPFGAAIWFEAAGTEMDPADFDRCGLEEVVDITIRAMGSATNAKDIDHGHD